MHKYFSLIIITVLFSIQAFSQPAVSAKGMVSSAQALASHAGVEMLSKGGNAVDAAVATGFALAVVHPTAGNIGGGGFMVIRLADGRSTCIDFRETAPRGGDRDMYLRADGSVDPQKSLVGYLASGVPGSVAGLHMALEKYGSLPLATVLEPAIKLAQKGFALTAGQAHDFNRLSKRFAAFPATAKKFLKYDGTPYQTGEIWYQPDLAKTLTLIKEQGPNAFYQGEIARLIAQAMQENGGLITLEDLVSYKAIERTPLVGAYKNYQIISMPPPSSGGIALLQMLDLIRPFSVSRMDRNGSAYIHLLAEAMRLAFADRAEFLGDPDFNEIPVQELLSSEYLDERRKLIDPEQAGVSLPDSHGQPRNENPETTHFSVADAQGMAVAVTTTLNGGYGSFVVIDGAGFLMNNEMDDFTAKPGVPNMFGLIQGEANAIEPYKRMLSSMTPTIVTRDSVLFMITGSPGGPTIINTVLHTILNTIEFNMPLDQAVNFPRFHHQWLPDEIVYESSGMRQSVLGRLAELGHSLRSRSSIGNVHAIAFDNDSNLFIGVADKRGEGKAIGIP
jgi:gamma-glutamyltranspeptidase / glutathione hydrolase